MSRVQKNVLVEEMTIRSLARAVSSQQKVVRIQPTTTTSVNSGSTSTSRIELPSQDYLLPTTSNLQFELAFNATTNNFKKEGVSSIVRNIRVYVGDQLVDLLQQRHIFEKFLIDVGGSSEAVQFGWDGGIRGDVPSPIGGTVDPSLSGTQHYNLRLSTGLLSYTGLLPLFAMPKIAIEIDWNPAAECLIDTSGATPSYTISNLYYVADCFVLEPSYTEALMARLSQGQPIDFQFTSFRLAGPIGLPAGANPTGSYKINSQVRSAKFIVCGIRDNANASFTQPIAIDNEANLANYQLKIGNDIMPNQPMLFGAQSRVELKECLNQIGMYNELGTIARNQYFSTTTYTSGSANTNGGFGTSGSAWPTYATKAFFGLNLEKWMSQLTQSGEDLMSRDVVLDLVAGSSLTTAKSLYVYVVFDAVLTLQSLYNATVSY